MSVNSAVVRFEWSHEKNKSSEDDFKTIYEGVEN